MERAIFAGGCFWCMIQPFDELDGIESIFSGYTAGHTKNPTYQEVKSHQTGHTEAVEIIFDPEKISFDDLLTIYWQQTDPTDAFGQFEDRGDNYRPVIFYFNDEQQQTALASKAALQASGRFTEPIVTAIEPAQPFYLAEDEHQDYYKKNPDNFARNHARRAAFLADHWDEAHA
ncbi:peptide-methionine (S)-S-oxide reductase MsrA [Enterococcus sp. N342-3-1-2]